MGQRGLKNNNNIVSLWRALLVEGHGAGVPSLFAQARRRRGTDATALCPVETTIVCHTPHEEPYRSGTFHLSLQLAVGRYLIR
jgi:hypothetical protein